MQRAAPSLRLDAVALRFGPVWIALMCVGHVWGYVPLRALTTHADIALAARGVGLSAWAFFPIVMLPALAIFLHFFVVFYRRRAVQVTLGHAANAMCLALLTGYWFFTYFGSAGGFYPAGVCRHPRRIGVARPRRSNTMSFTLLALYQSSQNPVPYLNRWKSDPG